MRLFNAYAGPSIWGDWVDVANSIGSVKYHLTAAAIGNATFRSQVRYFKTETDQVVEEWGDDYTITTGNAVATVSVRFMGIPTGTAIDGTIDP
jgi:hypothetical protein